MRCTATVSFLLFSVCFTTRPSAHADEAALRKAVTFYASFDDKLQADVGTGSVSTRSAGGKGTYDVTEGFNAKILRIAPGKGIAGAALEATDLLPNSGRVFFPVKGNMAFKKGGWNGSLSCWINTNPNTSLKTAFCDPIQITQKSAVNGGIWFDFNNAKPRRDMRMGLFPAIPPGQKGISEDDPKAPMVKLPGVDFKAGEWHHVLLTWENFDTGKADALGTLYLDGKKIGDVKDQAIAMDWDVDKAGIYVAVSYIGLLDELAIFNRALTAADASLLHGQPGVLSALKKK